MPFNLRCIAPQMVVIDVRTHPRCRCIASVYVYPDGVTILAGCRRQYRFLMDDAVLLTRAVAEVEISPVCRHVLSTCSRA
jgi:hypothetical protein